MTKTLTLFSASYCPFCVKVLRYLESRDISIEVRDIQDDLDAYQKLIEIGGKSQVPCLFIDGKPLYESDDIISWFEANYE